MIPYVENICGCGWSVSQFVLQATICVWEKYLWLCLYLELCLRQIFVFVRRWWRLFGQCVLETTIYVCVSEKCFYVELCLRQLFVCEKLPVCTWGKHLMFVFVFVFKTANFICNFVEAGICFLRSWWSIWTWDQHLHLYLWDTYLCLYLYFHLWQVFVFVRS